MRTDALNGRYAPSAGFASPEAINRDERVVVAAFYVNMNSYSEKGKMGHRDLKEPQSFVKEKIK